jgi:hypothetical protein
MQDDDRVARLLVKDGWLEVFSSSSISPDHSYSISEAARHCFFSFVNPMPSFWGKNIFSNTFAGSHLFSFNYLPTAKMIRQFLPQVKVCAVCYTLINGKNSRPILYTCN